LPNLFATVREVQRVHLEHVTARADFEKAYADLERAVGADLPRRTSGTHGKDHRHD